MKLDIGSMEVDRLEQAVSSAAAADFPGLAKSKDIKCYVPTGRTRKRIRQTVSKNGHQRVFRAELVAAYNGKCAICCLPGEEFLDAAHIIPERRGGVPVVTNGLLLCKNHHWALIILHWH